MQHLESWFDLWSVPLMALAITWACVMITRLLMRRAANNRRLRTLTELGPTASSLIYIVGLQLFVEAAPIPAKFGSWIEGAIYVFGVFIVLRLIRRAALVGMEWSSGHAPASTTLSQGFIPLVRNLITLFVFFIGGIMILQHFHYDVMSLITALGVGSLAVGLAAKDTLSNMISGFTLIIDRNLSPGDRVDLGGWVGEVQEIGLRSTLIRTNNGNTLIVPNSELVNTKILNLSQPSRSLACSTKFRVPFGVPFARIKPLCLEIIGQIPQVLAKPAPAALLSQLADYGQQVTVAFWVTDLNDEGPVISNFNEELLARLEREQIPMAAIPMIAPL